MPLVVVVPLAGLAYVLWHVWSVLPWTAAWRAVVVAVCLVCVALAVVSTTRLVDRWPMWLATATCRVGTSTLFVALYLFMAFVVFDVLRLVAVVPAAAVRHNGLAATVLALFVVVVFTVGNMRYNSKVRRELTLTAAAPVAGGDTLKVVMASDLHLGYNIRRGELARWVDMVNAEHADVILLAGDLIDMSLRPLADDDMAAELRRLNAPVYACVGNHEYYAAAGGRPGRGHTAVDMSGVETFYKEAGIRLLRDETAVVGPLCIIGRDDRSAAHRLTLSQLTAEARAAGASYTILLDHQPYHLEAAERAGIDFQLSGHTHHGQVWPLSWVTDAIYECAYGEHHRGATRYYVTSGLGIWGGKYRIGTCSEYVVATIR